LFGKTVQAQVVPKALTQVNNRRPISKLGLSSRMMARICYEEVATR
jgi:hypothetical protein